MKKNRTNFSIKLICGLDQELFNRVCEGTPETILHPRRMRVLISFDNLHYACTTTYHYVMAVLEFNRVRL